MSVALRVSREGSTSALFGCPCPRDNGVNLKAVVYLKTAFK
ncbi:hypothetical protein PULV_b0387 [Pseudoalteromonas ulvae UL12]|nr:hypothetical protein [Pseudoalteromonas ulvae UL12]